MAARPTWPAGPAAREPRYFRPFLGPVVSRVFASPDPGVLPVSHAPKAPVRDQGANTRPGVDTVFIVNPAGEITYRWDNTDPPSLPKADEVLTAL